MYNIDYHTTVSNAISLSHKKTEFSTTIPSKQERFYDTEVTSW